MPNRWKEVKVQLLPSPLKKKRLTTRPFWEVKPDKFVVLGPCGLTNQNRIHAAAE